VVSGLLRKRAATCKTNLHPECTRNIYPHGTGTHLDFQGKVAARRVVAVSSEIKPVTCPTGQNTPFENKAEKPALSNTKKPSSLARFMKTEHKRQSKMLGYCLTLGTARAWSGFSAVAATRMTEEERVALAFAALQSLPPQLAELAARAALQAAGAPVPAFLNEMSTARTWANAATTAELKAYTLAGFEAMSAADQAAFFKHISEVEIPV
jgi:hypothetical protein